MAECNAGHCKFILAWIFGQSNILYKIYLELLIHFKPLTIFRRTVWIFLGHWPPQAYFFGQISLKYSIKCKFISYGLSFAFKFVLFKLVRAAKSHQFSKMRNFDRCFSEGYQIRKSCQNWGQIQISHESTFNYIRYGILSLLMQIKDKLYMLYWL